MPVVKAGRSIWKQKSISAELRCGLAAKAIDDAADEESKSCRQGEGASGQASSPIDAHVPVIDHTTLRLNVMRDYGCLRRARGRMKTLIVVAGMIVATPVVGFVWCISAYHLAIADGRTSIPFVADFVRLLPNSTTGISYFTGTYGEPTYRCDGGVYGRYVVSMECPVHFTFFRARIKAFGQPTFYLKEVRSIRVLSDGRLDIEYGDTQLRFGIDKWNNIVANDGDIAALGIVVIKDKPLPSFDRCWRE